MAVRRLLIPKHLFRIHDCIRIGRTDYLLAETDDRKPYIVWQACRMLGITFHVHRYRHDTYADAIRDLSDRIKIPKPKIFMDEMDCIPVSYRQNYAGQLITIAPMILKEAHRRAENQLQIARDGAGCEPDAWNRPVHCESLRYGHQSTWDRQDILGIVRTDRLPRWARRILRDKHNTRTGTR